MFGLSPNASITYLIVPLSFVSVSAYPLTLAILMGQARPSERGALSGALRASEALAKVIGISGFGELFAQYIEVSKTKLITIN